MADASRYNLNAFQIIKLFHGNAHDRRAFVESVQELWQSLSGETPIWSDFGSQLASLVPVDLQSDFADFLRTLENSEWEEMGKYLLENTADQVCNDYESRLAALDSTNQSWRWDDTEHVWYEWVEGAWQKKVVEHPHGRSVLNRDRTEWVWVATVVDGVTPESAKTTEQRHGEGENEKVLAESHVKNVVTSFIASQGRDFSSKATRKLMAFAQAYYGGKISPANFRGES